MGFIQGVMNQISLLTDAAFKGDVTYRSARETEWFYQSAIDAIILKREDSSMALFDVYSAAIEGIKHSKEYRAASTRVNIARASVFIVGVPVLAATAHIALEVIGWMGAPSK